MSFRVLNCTFALFVCAGLPLLQGQEISSAMNHRSSHLQTLSRSAGTIFSGTVIHVQEFPAGTAGDLETVQITFRVVHALRGAHAGRNLTIREWKGLWDAGERYRVGERVLLFLYPTSNLGLTSPVAGKAGRFAMDDQERVIVSGEVFRELANPGQQTEIGADSRVSAHNKINYREIFRAIERGSGE